MWICQLSKFICAAFSYIFIIYRTDIIRLVVILTRLLRGKELRRHLEYSNKILFAINRF